MTDYEKLYQEDAKVCGDPFPELVSFFKKYDGKSLDVLDLGCGQGRDSLMIARNGHSVVGVDLSTTGVQQMVKIAQKEGLEIVGVVADLKSYKPEKCFDVIVIDRTLHMLKSDSLILDVLNTVTDNVNENGFVLIIDTPKNRNTIESHFMSDNKWLFILNRKEFIFVKKSNTKNDE